jgi:16S rRNA processing protein RimM
MKPAEPEFITVGQVLAPWGVRGKLKVKVITEFPERFAPSARVYIKRQPMSVESAQWQKGRLVLKLDQVDSRQAAQKLRGQPIEIHRSQLYPLPEGQYYHFQIVGLEVWTTQGERLGKITDILSAPSNDNYVVRGAKGEILIPAIADVVKSIDLERGRVTIEPIKGLLT